ncbi:MAG: hypothetical protein PUJ55_00435, partial [Clostridiales bacterium]|nr:hypothetical protein [Clostridiales bacterium]MDY4114245.1 hypothetical protein [Roseburia sp.]
MQGKVCGKKRHTKTEIRSEISELICGRIAAGENYNLTRDIYIWINVSAGVAVRCYASICALMWTRYIKFEVITMSSGSHSDYLFLCNKNIDIQQLKIVMKEG